MNKNKIILGVFALVSVLAIALGFAAAFGKMQTMNQSGSFIEISIKDGFDQVKDMPADIKDLMSTTVAHVNFAWIGGIITGVLGILGLGTAGFVMFKGIELNKTLMIVVLAAVVTMFALAIAAIVSQGQLNSQTWIIDQAKKA